MQLLVLNIRSKLKGLKYMNNKDVGKEWFKAEKALKAFLVHKDIDPPRTHDLRLLRRRVTLIC